MRKTELTVEDMKGIINMRKKGFYVNDIADKYGTTNGTVSRLYRAFNGNEKIYNSIGKEAKELIDKCRDDKSSANNVPQRYEVKIFFGLITLKVNPIS